MAKSFRLRVSRRIFSGKKISWIYLWLEVFLVDKKLSEANFFRTCKPVEIIYDRTKLH